MLTGVIVSATISDVYCSVSVVLSVIVDVFVVYWFDSFIVCGLSAAIQLKVDVTPLLIVVARLKFITAPEHEAEIPITPTGSGLTVILTVKGLPVPHAPVGVTVYVTTSPPLVVLLTWSVITPPGAGVSRSPEVFALSAATHENDDGTGGTINDWRLNPIGTELHTVASPLLGASGTKVVRFALKLASPEQP